MHAGDVPHRSSFVALGRIAMRTMKAAVFVEPGRIVLDEKPIPSVGPGDALIKVTTTTICGTDVYILKGEYPVAPGRIVGHEPVGVIEALGPGVTGYAVGQRVTSAPSPRVDNATPAWAGIKRSAEASPSAAGASGTRSTGARPNTCWCRTPWRTSPPCPRG
jgi:NADPH:quinone reductase-like Zn-dependent oxidoreductase